MMWLREYDKNGWQNAYGHFTSQNVIEEWQGLCDGLKGRPMQNASRG